VPIDPPVGDFGGNAEYYDATQGAGEGATDVLLTTPDETPAHIDFDVDADGAVASAIKKSKTPKASRIDISTPLTTRTRPTKSRCGALDVAHQTALAREPRLGRYGTVVLVRMVEQNESRV
jgi:hypothetical protein